MSSLDLQLIARRIGWIPCVTAALVIAALTVFVLGTAKVARAIDERGRELAQLRENAANPKQVVVDDRPLIEQRLDAFTALLGEKRNLNNAVAVVFAQSGKHGLALAQAEYRLEYDKRGGFYKYRMTLPVRGPYVALRRFVDATLQSVPFAALDDIAFKRDGIGVAQTEAQMGFVFYLKDTGP